MRSLATLLVLMLALPGLVLPAGFLLRICRCASAAASAAAATPGCCATHSCCATPVAKPATPPATCCEHCCTSEDRGDDGPVQVAPRACKCVWVKVPDHQPKPAPPQEPPGPDAPALLPATSGVMPVLADAGRRLPTFEVARPPPRDHHRTLPLLL